MYELWFLVGAIGFGALAALSFVGSHSQHGNQGHGGHHHGPTGEPVGRIRVPVPRGHRGPVPVRGSAPARAVRSAFSLSPLDVFAYALGFGAAGLLLRPYHLTFELWLAIAGALVLNHGLIKPLMALLLRFASNPSEGLEGMVAHEAEAVTKFDAQGQGLVRLVLDGETVQVLARLQPGEDALVAKGDRVIVTDVDPVRNRLTVTRELS